MKRSDIKKRPLSDTVLENLKPEDKDYRELDGNGLYFFVQKNGNKSWQLRYKKPDDNEELILVFPVWASTLPPAVRTFLEKEGRARVICIPTSLGSKLKDRDGFAKIIDLVGKKITAPISI